MYSSCSLLATSLAVRGKLPRENPSTQLPSFAWLIPSLPLDAACSTAAHSTLLENVWFKVRDLLRDWSNGCAVLALFNGACPGVVGMPTLDPLEHKYNITRGTALFRVSHTPTYFWHIEMHHAAALLAALMMRY